MIHANLQEPRFPRFIYSIQFNNEEDKKKNLHAVKNQNPIV